MNIDYLLMAHGVVNKKRKPKIMTAVIDQSNSNPLTCVSYEDDAKMMERGSAKWDEFFGTKLVLFKGGKEVRDLEDAELNSLKPEDGDVMVKFKRMGLNIKTIGDKVYVSMTNDPDNEDFKYYAHTRGTTKKDAFYLGAYLGYVVNGKLRSVTGVAPSGNSTIGAFRTLAQANGSGYEQFAFYQLVFVQAMYILKYGNLDAQTALGAGLTDSTNHKYTGHTNGKGVDFGSDDANEQMRFQYLEDLYGNKTQWIDGCGTMFYKFWTRTENFNNSFTGYSSFAANSMSYAYSKTVWGDNDRGFVGKTSGGSTTTHYCDSCNMSPSESYFSHFGGHTTSKGGAGMFYFSCNFSDKFSYSHSGARLMFL